MEYQLNMKVNKTKIRLKMVPVDYRSPNCQRVVRFEVIIINEEEFEIVIFLEMMQFVCIQSLRIRHENGC